MTEKEIERQILDYLHTLPGCVAWKHHQLIANKHRRRGKYEPKGIPDIIGVYRGRFIAIEVKRPKGGVVKQEQKLFIELLNKYGGLAFIATSVEDVQRYLACEEIWLPTLH